MKLRRKVKPHGYHNTYLSISIAGMQFINVNLEALYLTTKYAADENGVLSILELTDYQGSNVRITTALREN